MLSVMPRSMSTRHVDQKSKKLTLYVDIITIYLTFHVHLPQIGSIWSKRQTGVGPGKSDPVKNFRSSDSDLKR